MRVVHVGVNDWLLLDEVYQPRCLIHYGPAIWRATGETLMVYRVERWALERAARRVLGRYENFSDAVARAEEEWAPMQDPPPQWGLRTAG